MTGEQSRTLGVGERVRWGTTATDFGAVTETNWAAVIVKWDNRSVQAILRNDMARVERVKKLV